jgi:hypothetical protein
MRNRITLVVRASLVGMLLLAAAVFLVLSWRGSCPCCRF